MKNSEVKKMQALSIRRDDVVSDENWFQMMRDIFFGYENEVMCEKAAEQKSKEDAEAEEACKRGKKEIVDSMQEITRLAMEISLSDCKPLVLVRVSPHASTVSVDVFRHGYRRDTLPTETLTAYYGDWSYSKSTVPTHSDKYRGTCLDTLCDVSDIVQRLHDLLEEVTSRG